MIRNLSLCIVLSLTLAGTVQAQTSAAGAALYNQHGCYTCHGHQGKGTHVECTNNLFPAPPILLAGKTPFLASEEVFRAYLRLRADQQPPEPSVKMPHFSAEVLDDADVAALYAHIMAFPVDEPALENTVMGWALDHAEKQ